MRIGTSIPAGWPPLPSSTNRTVNKEDTLNVEFSYSVHWKQTHIPFERRMEKYSRYSFLPQHLEIH